MKGNGRLVGVGRCTQAEKIHKNLRSLHLVVCWVIVIVGGNVRGRRGRGYVFRDVVEIEWRNVDF